MQSIFFMRMVFLVTAAVCGFVLASPASAQEADGAKAKKGRTQLILAASWQPGFCETRPKKPECQSQTTGRQDATRFSLHGLWKMRQSYCGISEDVKLLDKKSKGWLQLPAVALPAATAEEIKLLMPGAQSGLDRHEWVKHGSCSGMDAAAYFEGSARLMRELNASPVQALFAANIGKPLKEAEIKLAFDKAFGSGSGDRVKMRCAKDGDRRVITGLTIGLNGALDDRPLAEMISGAGTTKFNCPEGIVDAVGIQ